MSLGKEKNTKPVDKGKKHVVISTPSSVASTSTGPSSSLRNKLQDKAKVTAAMIQELTEELQSIDQESLMMNEIQRLLKKVTWNKKTVKIV